MAFGGNRARLGLMSEKVERPKLDVAELARPFVIVGMVVAVMWAEEIIDLMPGTNFDKWGIRPRTISGLVGIPLAPFLHAGFPHLIGNTLPFLLLGGIIAVGGIARYFQVTVLVALVSGIGTWLLGASHTDHIGASGVVFGYLTYLLARGFFDKKLSYLLVGVVVFVIYGGILWGVIPKEGISWTGHIFGAVGGVVAAWALRTRKEGAKPKDKPEPNALPGLT